MDSENISKNNIKKYLPLIMILIAFTLCFNTTLALFVFNAGKSSYSQIAKIEVNPNVNYSKTLNNITEGTTLTNEVKVSKTAQSKNCYIRVGISFTKVGASEDELNYLRVLNASGVTTVEDSVIGYEWSQNIDGYYYLTDFSGNMLEVTGAEEYGFVNSMSTPGISGDGLIDVSNTIGSVNFEICVQALQSQFLDTTNFEGIRYIFTRSYQDEVEEQCLVNFDSNEGSVVPKLNVTRGSTITLPTNPTRDQYIFMGWYVDYGFINVFDVANPILSDINLVAKWELII